MKDRPATSSAKTAHDLCAECPLRPEEALSQAMLDWLDACIKYLERKREAVAVERMKVFPDAKIESRALKGPSRRRRRRRKDDAASGCAPALDRFVIANDGKEIWVGVKFVDLSASLKLLLSVLGEDGEATSDGLVGFKLKLELRERLGAADGEILTEAALKELFYRLRLEFIDRGLNPELIESPHGKARLRVSRAPPTQGCDEEPTM